MVLRTIKTLGKSALRSMVRARLDWLPLSMAQAEHLAQQIKDYPAVLGTLNYRTAVQLPTGVEMEVGIVDVIERTLLTQRHWDPLIEQSLQRLLNPGDTFLDVGANIGYFTTLASKLVGDNGVVVSFEPSARALTRLAAHVCMNRCRNVLICSHAVGESTATTQLNWATASNIGGTAIDRGNATHGIVERTLVRRIDDVCQDLGLKPSLMKVDIEGFELFALRGAKATLDRYRPDVVCELTEAFLQDHHQSSQELIGFMTGLGYRGFRLSLSPSGEIEVNPLSPENIPADQAEVLFSFREEPFRSRR